MGIHHAGAAPIGRQRCKDADRDARAHSPQQWREWIARLLFSSYDDHAMTMMILLVDGECMECMECNGRQCCTNEASVYAETNGRHQRAPLLRPMHESMAKCAFTAIANPLSVPFAVVNAPYAPPPPARALCSAPFKYEADKHEIHDKPRN